MTVVAKQRIQDTGRLPTRQGAPHVRVDAESPINPDTNLASKALTPAASTRHAVRHVTSGFCQSIDDGSLLWPERLRCDVIDAPLAACCGVIAHLACADAEVCPVAQLADRLLFLVAEGSSVSWSAKVEGLPAGVVLAGAVERFPDRGNGGLADGCWVIPPDCGGPVLPPAGVVLAALRSAYMEYLTATEIKSV